MECFYVLKIEVVEESGELVQALLDDTEHLGMEVRDSTLKLPPGTPGLPPGKIQFFAYFQSDATAREAREQVGQNIPDALFDINLVEQEDWTETWKQHVHGVRVGRVWVGPPWESALDAPISIVIEPGMAFGTGDHPTTSMCLGALDDVLGKRPGASVLDVGTGSGVLAIAARKLGAGRVLGNDIDPMAVRIAKENLQKNAVLDVELTEKPVERIQSRFKVIVANLFSSVLCQLAPRLVALLEDDGELLATGILLPQADEVQASFEREGLVLQEKKVSGEWVLLAFGNRG